MAKTGPNELADAIGRVREALTTQGGRGLAFTAPILLVEDDDVDVLSVKRAARSAELANPIQVARSGPEALEMLRQQGAGRGRPGLILLDLNLPRMSGHEVLAAVKGDETLREIPVVILSTSDQETDVRRSYQGGAAGYVVKPVEFEGFVRVIRAIRDYWSLARLPA